jgi:hypothetical protein
MTRGVEVRRQIIVSEADLAYVEEVAAQNGVTVEQRPVQGVLPVFGVVLIIAGGVAAVAAVQHLVEVHRGGQVIDLRTGSPRPFYRSHDLTYGLVLIYKDDGTIEIKVVEVKDAFSEVIEALKDIVVDLGKATIDAAKKSVTAAVGAKGEVEVGPPVTPPPAGGS